MQAQGYDSAEKSNPWGAEWAAMSKKEKALFAMTRTVMGNGILDLDDIRRQATVDRRQNINATRMESLHAQFNTSQQAALEIKEWAHESLYEFIDTVRNHSRRTGQVDFCNFALRDAFDMEERMDEVFQEMVMFWHLTDGNADAVRSTLKWAEKLVAKSKWELEAYQSVKEELDARWRQWYKDIRSIKG